MPFRVKRPVAGPDAEWHCGICTSCLLRRQAIFAAGLAQNDEESFYRKNVCRPGWASKKKDDEPLLMMLDQVALFQRLLDTEDAIVSLFCEFPELSMACRALQQKPECFGLDATTDSVDVVVKLLRCYSNEWQSFPYQLT